jgi:S-adenosylmethionine uptake transporter
LRNGQLDPFAVDLLLELGALGPEILKFPFRLLALGLLLAIGLLATMAQWMMTLAYGTGATMGVAALQYLGIVFSFLLGVLIFDEQLTLMALGGVLLIIGAGVAATLLQPRPSNSRAAPTET